MISLDYSFSQNFVEQEMKSEKDNHSSTLALQLQFSCTPLLLIDLCNTTVWHHHFNIHKHRIHFEKTTTTSHLFPALKHFQSSPAPCYIFLKSIHSTSQSQLSSARERASTFPRLVRQQSTPKPKAQ